VLSVVFGPDLTRLQPLILLGGGVYVKTRHEAGPATLVSAFGVRHPLRRLCSVTAMLERLHAGNRSQVRQLLLRELARRRAESCSDPFAYFLDYLAPAFRERDWSEERSLVAGEPAVVPEPPDLSAQVEAALANIPVPRLPSPSLVILGRVWLLGSARVAPGRTCVIAPEGALALTGEYVTVWTLESDWRARVQSFISSAAARLAEVSHDRVPADLRAARGELSRAGCLQVGDLLFLAGTPPLLGHILPPHYNRALGRYSARDLAVAAPLELPPKVGSLSIWERTSAGGWTQVGLPHGLCLGPKVSGEIPDQPGLNLAAHLRWAAVRLAGNGKFHEADPD